MFSLFRNLNFDFINVHKRLKNTNKKQSKEKNVTPKSTFNEIKKMFSKYLNKYFNTINLITN